MMNFEQCGTILLILNHCLSIWLEGLTRTMEIHSITDRQSEIPARDITNTGVLSTETPLYAFSAVISYLVLRTVPTIRPYRMSLELQQEIPRI